MMKNAVALLVMFLSGFQAAAQPIGAREAQGALFGTRGEVVFPEGTDWAEPTRRCCGCCSTCPAAGYRPSFWQRSG